MCPEDIPQESTDAARRTSQCQTNHANNATVTRIDCVDEFHGNGNPGDNRKKTDVTMNNKQTLIETERNNKRPDRTNEHADTEMNNKK